LDVFDFYTENNKSVFSSKNIQNLTETRTFRTNHEDNRSIFKTVQLKNGQFVTCSADNTIRIWTLDGSIPEKVLTGHTKHVLNIIMLSNGRLCSASDDRTIRIWNIDNGVCEKTYSGYHGSVYALVELPNDVLIGGGLNQIRFWNLRSENSDNACIRTLKAQGHSPSILLISNEEMACASNHNIIIFKIYGSDAPLKKLIGHQNRVWDLLLHADRHILFSVSEDNTMRMWNIQSGSCIRTFNGNSMSFRMIWFNKKTVATAYCNGEIKLWNIDTGKCERTLKRQDGGVFGLVIDSNEQLISYGHRSSIQFWS